MDGSVEYERLAYLKSWHWIYRIQMALRTSGSLHRAMYMEFKRRYSKVLKRPWGTEAAGWLGKEAVTLGDVFSSQLLTTMLVRWDVFKPAEVMGARQKAKKTLYESLPLHILRYARENITWVDWRADCTTWHAPDDKGSSPYQRALIGAAIEVVKTFPSKGNRTDKTGEGKTIVFYPTKRALHELMRWRWPGDDEALSARPFTFDATEGA
jgi:hypothetical protein